MNTIQYNETKYFIQQDGTVLRVLKPTQIKGQVYFNLIIDGKMKRINKEKLAQMFSDSSIKDA
jgi:hypothetical protein